MHTWHRLRSSLISEIARAREAPKRVVAHTFEAVTIVDERQALINIDAAVDAKVCRFQPIDTWTHKAAHRVVACGILWIAGIEAAVALVDVEARLSVVLREPTSIARARELNGGQLVGALGIEVTRVGPVGTLVRVVNAHWSPVREMIGQDVHRPRRTIDPSARQNGPRERCLVVEGSLDAVSPRTLVIDDTQVHRKRQLNLDQEPLPVWLEVRKN
eukprot:2881371-Rhodomonas_salina.3